MKMIINGLKINTTPPDIDKDGEVGDFENVERQFNDNGVSDIMQPSEISESMKEINSDLVDEETKMSSIDMKSRLSKFELPSIIAIDSMVALNVFPLSALKITRSKKRNAVSIGGMGRKEQVTIATGIQEQRNPSSDSGLMEIMKNGFNKK